MQTTLDTVESRRRAWSSYWQAGALHSCPTSFSGDYQGAIGALWRDLADQLRPPLRVLDLGTGNGALPKLLWQHMHGPQDLVIDAVDLAQLRPDWHDARDFPGIRFHAGVAMETLPFASQSFDCAVSQYGIEYAQRSRVFDEVLRVTKPAAQLQFVMHHAEGELVRVAHEEAGHQAWLLASGGLLEAAGEVLPWIARARLGQSLTGVPEAEAARQRYNQLMGQLQGRAQASSVPDLLNELGAWLHRLLAQGQNNALGALRQAEQQLDQARFRTEELVACALDAEQIGSIAEQFRSARPNARVHVDTVRQDDRILGWSLRVDGRV
ncbi:MAG TPA: class I SAM-dependent methyltransferase [Chiayiivirga sp.]|nr:class I SAM-dependent methyltransferase [Chiayiivirga sp.]